MTAEDDALADLEDYLYEQALAESDDPVWRAMAWISELVPSDDLDRLARQVHAVLLLRQTVATFLSVAEPQLAELMPTKVVELPGLPPFEKRQGKDRKRWATDDLVRRLVRDALDPDRTGELSAEQAEAGERVARVLTACAPFTPSMPWRVAPLRAALGMEKKESLDEWCEELPGKVSVQWHGGDR